MMMDAEDVMDEVRVIAGELEDLKKHVYILSEMLVKTYKGETLSQVEIERILNMER